MSPSRRRRPSRRAEPAAPPAPYGRRVIGVDLGARRIGLAVTDAGGAFVATQTVLERRSLDADRTALSALLDDYPVATIVVGLPLNMDGTEGPQARRSRRWAADLFAGRAEPIVFQDERLTTDSARQAGAGTAQADAAAAALILLDFLREPRQ